MYAYIYAEKDYGIVNALTHMTGWIIFVTEKFEWCFELH